MAAPDLDPTEIEREHLRRSIGRVTLLVGLLAALLAWRTWHSGQAHIAANFALGSVLFLASAAWRRATRGKPREVRDLVAIAAADLGGLASVYAAIVLQP